MSDDYIRHIVRDELSKFFKPLEAIPPAIALEFIDSGDWEQMRLMWNALLGIEGDEAA